MSGRTAVTGESTQRILVKQLTEAIPPLASVRSDLPASLCDVVDRCCAKEADDRYANAEAVVEALDATQLATPDVPVAMRLLAPELTGAVVRAVVAAVLLTYGAISIVRSSNGNGFSAGVIAAALAWVSTLSGLREIRRLRGSGYSVDQLQRLLRLTLQERDEERARRRTDTALVRRRRIRVALAFGILVTQVFALASMLSGVRSGDGAKFSGTKALVIFFAALLSAALAVAILASSPFRRSVSEQLFSTVWLGAIGRRLMQWAGSAKAAGRSMAPEHASAQAKRAPVTSASAAAGSAPERKVSLDLLAADVSSLRARVDALESRGKT
jgi:eukaryotic-like serine/threonine-protein kinase